MSILERTCKAFCQVLYRYGIRGLPALCASPVHVAVNVDQSASTSFAHMVSVESARLAAFLRSRGASVHEDLEFFARRASGARGVFAAAPIARGSLLLRLPREAVLTACDDGGAGSEWMPEGARNASPILRAALCLLREEAHGAQSSWAPYMATLPTGYDTLENWTQEELAALRGTSVYDELDGLRDPKTGDLVGPTRVLWERSIAPIVEASPQHWPDGSMEAFLRACAAVRTRGFCALARFDPTTSGL